MVSVPAPTAAIFWTSVLLVIFAAATCYGLGTKTISDGQLGLAIGASSIFWLLGALYPMWWAEKTHSAGLMNAIAASAAMYAGLAALKFGLALHIDRPYPAAFERLGSFSSHRSVSGSI